jgi:hypothetical protein
MLDPDTFLTTWYVLVDDVMPDLPPLRHPGPAAQLTLSAVVTLALFAQWRQFGRERALYRDAGAHWRGAFPRRPARSQSNRLVRRGPDALVAGGPRRAPWLAAPTCASDARASRGGAVRTGKRRGPGWREGQAATGWGPRWGYLHGLTLRAAVTPWGPSTG